MRRFLPELIEKIWTRQINPGKVFDLTLPLEKAAEGYAAMDDRTAIKVLLQPVTTRTAPGFAWREGPLQLAYRESVQRNLETGCRYARPPTLAYVDLRVGIRATLWASSSA